MKADGLDLSIWVAAGVLTISPLRHRDSHRARQCGIVSVGVRGGDGIIRRGKNDAKTFSFIMFFALTLPLLIGGAVAVAMTGLNISELRDRAKHGIQTAHRGQAD
jgi:hypothetical protein